MSLNPGTKLGAFEITGLLGKGGMGEVYRARDSKLGRDVAIKVLPEDFAADGERLARFEREAKVLASLDHPNIGALYDFQEVDGLHFLVLQLVEGETLADRIAKGAISVGEALPLFVHIAQGLATAHERGVVHRDLKPDNVKIAPDGLVKVLDFGIAKSAAARPQSIAPDAPTTPVNPLAVTAEGTFIGTPTYMAPEQARGKEVDKRADVWAFGCCLFEALTGLQPFTGETVTDVVVAIVERQPDWALLPALPKQVKSVLRRCLEKDPNRRLTSMGDLAITLEEALDDLKQPASAGTPAQKPQSALPKIALTAVASLILGAVLTFVLMRNDGGGPSSAPLPQATKITSLAVLPFENYSGEAAQEYYVDGMTDTLTAELARIKSITVKARASAMRFKGTDKAPEDIARELGVDGLVTGTFQKAGSDIQFNAQLIDGTTGQLIWAEKFSGTDENVLRLEGEVAIAIAKEIGAVVTPEEAAHYERAASVDPVAWDLYLQARDVWRQRTEAGFEEAIDILERVTKTAPDFTEAHALLALVYATAPLNFGADFASYFEKAERAAHRALELDPRAIDAHFALVWTVMLGDWNWQDSYRRIQTTLEIDPNSDYAHFAHGLYLSWTGRQTEALIALRRAIEFDSLYPLYYVNQARVLRSLGRWDEALRSALRFVELQSSSDSSELAWVYIERGQFDKAQAAISSSEPGASRSEVEIALLIAKGETDEAIERLDAQSEDPNSELYFPAVNEAELGRVDQALDALERSRLQHDNTFTEQANDPALAPLWDEPRYWEILAKANMPAFPPENPAYEAQQRYLADQAAQRAMAAQPPVRFTIVPPLEAPLAGMESSGREIAISPDGRTVVYVAIEKGNTRLYRRDLDSLDAPRPIPGTEGARVPQFARGSRDLTFSTVSPNLIKKVSLDGGAVQTVAERPSPTIIGTALMEDGTIIFDPGSGGGLARIPYGSNELQYLTEVDTSREELWHGGPVVLQDRDTVLFFVVPRSGISASRIEALSLKSGERKILIEGGAMVQYSPTGHLIYGHVGKLMAVAFDLNKVEVTGAPFVVLQNIVTRIGGHADFSVSEEGTLAYVPADSHNSGSLLAWVSLTGEIEPLPIASRVVRNPALSPDGRQLAVSVGKGGVFDIWLFDVVRGSGRRLTSEPDSETSPVWHPDGRRIAYAQGTAAAIVQAVGPPKPETIDLLPGLTGSYRPTSWVTDGDTLILSTTASGSGSENIKAYSSEKNSLEDLVISPYVDGQGVASPDGRWLAYQSDESGKTEVYVRAMRSNAGAIPVSIDGGWLPLWAPDGTAIYYTYVQKMLRVAVEDIDSMRLGRPEVLFEAPFQISGSRSYDIAPDGKRFIMMFANTQSGSGREIVIVKNFFGVLNRLDPRRSAN